MSSTLHLLLKFHEAQKNAHHCGQRFERVVSGNVRRDIPNRRQATFGREKVSVQPVLQEISDVKGPKTSRRRSHRQSRVSMLLLQPQVRTQRPPHAARKENACGGTFSSAATASSKSNDSALFTQEFTPAASPAVPLSTHPFPGPASASRPACGTETTSMVPQSPDTASSLPPRPQNGAVHGHD